jgi:hypothetical protein
MDSIDVEIVRDADGEGRQAQIRFGPHHRVEVWRDAERATFSLVATHHGFKADASEPGGELERLID